MTTVTMSRCLVSRAELSHKDFFFFVNNNSSQRELGALVEKSIEKYMKSLIIDDTLS